MCRIVHFFAPDRSQGEAVDSSRSLVLIKAVFPRGCVAIRSFILGWSFWRGKCSSSVVRKEAALDLHSPFSTSHVKPIRPPDRPLASPFLTFLPFASFELWPQQWGRFFGGEPVGGSNACPGVCRSWRAGHRAAISRARVSSSHAHWKFLTDDPKWDPFRSDARFLDLLRNVALSLTRRKPAQDAGLSPSPCPY